MAEVSGVVHKRSGAQPVLVTDAVMSPAEEYARRRHRYDVMMALRVVCVIGAAVAGTVFSAVWLALVFIVGAAVLPWAAVLIANDRLPRAERVRRAAPAPGAAPLDRQLPAAPTSDGSGHRVIEG